MKKLIITSLAALSLLSCSNDDYAALNVDPKNPSEVPASFLFTNGVKSLFDQMVSTNVNRNVFRLFAQQWTETQYIDEANFNIRNRAIPDAHWNRMYTDVLFDLGKAKEAIEADNSILSGQKNNQKAIVSIIEVYAWQQLVDTFGNIPYTEALAGTGNTTPAYDDAATIYKDLLIRISEAYTLFDNSQKGFDNDFIYSNDISKWKKLAASLQFKLAMRLADVDATTSKTYAEDAISKGLLASNEDNFILNYEANTANGNPIYSDLVLSGRNDFVPANTFVDYLNGLEDPRRVVFFDDNLTPYKGGVFGDFNTYVNYTHLSQLFHTQDLKGNLMDYSEISFLLAEAKERGYNAPNTAANYYKQGITASMEYWGVSTTDIATYLARVDVDYTTASGTWKEKIGKQFWIAMFNRGFEGWTVWRIYDAPTLNIPVRSGSPVPLRYTYPVRESRLNTANYNQAASAIGGDDQQTKLFWDVN